MASHSSSRRRKARRGSAAAELALTLPILMTLGLGGVEWGWYFHQVMATQDAVRQGARDGMAQQLDPGGRACTACVAVGRSRAQAYLQVNGMPHDDLVTADVVTLADGALALRVRADVPYTTAAGGLVPLPSTIRTETTWRLQHQ